jgi:hypothetical protein
MSASGETAVSFRQHPKDPPEKINLQTQKRPAGSRALLLACLF